MVYLFDVINFCISLYNFGQTLKWFGSPRFLEYLIIWNGGYITWGTGRDRRLFLRKAGQGSVYVSRLDHGSASSSDNLIRGAFGIAPASMEVTWPVYVCRALVCAYAGAAEVVSADPFIIAAQVPARLFRNGCWLCKNAGMNMHVGMEADRIRMKHTPSVPNYKSFQEYWRVKPSQSLTKIIEKHKNLWHQIGIL
jgi:hypothetical protein